MSDGVDNFENAEERGGIANFICSKDVLAVLPTEFRKSVLVQLIPGLCFELYNNDDVPDELEQHFKCEFSPFVAAPFHQTMFLMFSVEICKFFDSCVEFFDLLVCGLTDRLSSTTVKSVEIILKIFNTRL